MTDAANPNAGSIAENPNKKSFFFIKITPSKILGIEDPIVRNDYTEKAGEGEGLSHGVGGVWWCISGGKRPQKWDFPPSPNAGVCAICKADCLAVFTALAVETAKEPVQQVPRFTF
ncbi:MAG: hypothetical protein LBU18_07180 [Treponema sp.]|jgi:hypothetical protein|nr:hypothetical protein [Treponema sp.]